MLENLKFEKITDGTPFENSIVWSIIQDSKGFTWFATGSGLVRFDGFGFKIMSRHEDNSTGKTDYGFKSMIQMDNDKLLLLTFYLSNLLEFDLENEIFKSENIFDITTKNTNFFNRLLRINNDEIWIGTHGYGIHSYNRKNKLLKKIDIESISDYENLTCNFANCFFFDKDSENIYIGTQSEGLAVYDVQNRTIRKVVSEPEVPEKGVHVNTILKDSEGLLWIGQSNGLYLHDRNGCFVRSYRNDESREGSISGNFVNTICEDDQGLIWIGTKFNGLNCYDKREDRFHRINLNKQTTRGKFKDSINILFKDRTNVIWIGCWYGGFGRFDRDIKHFFRLSDENYPMISELNVITIYIDSRNSYWLGTQHDGLYKYSIGNDNSYELIHIKDLEKTTILSIIPDGENCLWIGCNKYGLIRMFIDTNTFEIVEQELFLQRRGRQFFAANFICRDSSNRNHLWLAVDYQGLVIYDTKNNEFVKDKTITESLANIPVNWIFEDSNGDTWITTQGLGIFKYILSNNCFVNFNHDPTNDKSISDSILLTAAEDQNKNLWFGTLYGKLNKLENTGKEFIRIGVSENFISAMLFEDGDKLWISSNDLLIKYNITTDEIVNHRTTNRFNFSSCFRSSDGTFYFGGTNGVTYFKPEEITTNPHIPQIALTDFQILHESVKPSLDNPFLKKSITYADEITLTHKENVITFEFASLIYNDPKQNQHAYKMEGFDEDWVYCGTRRSATYTNLDPGEYTFRVKGSNNDGLWNEEGTSIKLKISPPWHKTVLFKSLIGLGALAGLGSFYRKRISRLNEENIQREEFTKKLIESQENERKRVAAELHDSIGQDLLILKNKLLTNIKKTGDEKFIQQLSELSELTSSAIDDVRQISYNLRPYELDRLGLTKTIESMIERANNFTDITFTGILDDIDKMFPPETGINIYRIIQESLNNVIKHSDARKVIVRVTKHSSYIYLSISDNGKGFDMRSHRMSSERNGFGLKGIEERVKLLGGEFNIDSELGKGTLIEIVIPYNTGT